METSPYKNELEIANDILGILQNVKDRDDANEFARIYIEAIEQERNEMKIEQVDKSLIYKHLSEVDSRIEDE